MVTPKDLIKGKNYCLQSDAWGDGVINAKLVAKYLYKDNGEYIFRINKRSSNWKTDEFKFYFFSRMNVTTNIGMDYEGGGQWSVNGRSPEKLLLFK